MGIKLKSLGAAQEVGRSAFILSTDKKFLLDYGIKIFGRNQKPEFPNDIDEHLDAVFLSHAHMDHSGFIPNLYRFSKAKWYSTAPTRDLCQLLWKDSMRLMGENLPYKLIHYEKAFANWMPFFYKQNLYMGKTKVHFLDAGHIAGSAMAEFVYEKKKILYTGDFKVEQTRMHYGAKPVENADVLIIDSTYATKEHPNRKETEKKIVDEIEETLNEGGNILMPAFALGRTQELIRIIRSYNKDVNVYVDGMGRKMCDIYIKHSKYIKNPEEFQKQAKSVRMVRGPHDKRMATEEPSVIIASAGMLEGGPALQYLTNLNANSKIVFTGYCVEGTNGWKLQNEGYVTINEEDLKVDLPIEYHDLSAHAGRSDILNFIKWANPEKVVIVHSDVAKEFERELKEDFGYNAVAPKVGEIIEL